MTVLTRVMAIVTEVNQMTLGRETISPSRTIYTDTTLLGFLR